MFESCPAPEKVIHLPLGAGVSGSASGVLLKSAGLELIRLVIPAGKEIPAHKVPVEVTVQCLEGRVSFTHDGSARELGPGDLVYLCPGELHAVKGIENASLLVTRLRPHAADLLETLETA